MGVRGVKQADGENHILGVQGVSLQEPLTGDRLIVMLRPDSIGCVLEDPTDHLVRIHGVGVLGETEQDPGRDDDAADHRVQVGRFTEQAHNVMRGEVVEGIVNEGDLSGHTDDGRGGGASVTRKIPWNHCVVTKGGLPAGLGGGVA
jgi:hypothetical protein